MTRFELLKIVIGRARSHGFEFRKWYTGRLSLPWTSAEDAIATLDTQRRYYALLFSHEFARHFWKPGEDLTFEVPAATFSRVLPDGTTRTVTRKPFVRRSARRDAWRYHLRQMALAEEPLRYIRKYLSVEDELLELDAAAATAEELPPKSPKATAKAPAASRSKPLPRPLPNDLPAFLRRPYGK